MAYRPEYQKIGVTRMDPASLQNPLAAYLKQRGLMDPSALGRVTPGPGPTGLAALLQRPGIKDALFATGMALLAQKDQPGSLGGALGRALPVGMQAYQQGQQEAQMDSVLSGMPPETQRLFGALGREGKAQVLSSLLASRLAPPPPKDLMNVGPNATVFDPNSKQPIYTNTQEPKPEVPNGDAALDTAVAQWSFRTGKPPAALANEPDEVKQAVFDAADKIRNTSAPKGNNISVIQPGESAAKTAFGKSVGEADASIIAGEKQADVNLQNISNIDELIGIVGSEKFKNISGPIFGTTLGQVTNRLVGDEESKRLQGGFNALSGQLTMQKLSQFTGTKSDFEFRQAQRIAMGDPKMTPTEMQAGLALLRRVEVEAARKWSTDMNSIDPTRYGFTEQSVARQKEKARSILNRFDPAGIR